MMRQRHEGVDSPYSSGLTAAFAHRLRTLVTLTDREEQFITSLQADRHFFTAGAQIYSEGDPVVRPWIVASGWACRMRTLPDGRRQTISLFLPGDTVGIQDLQHPAAQCPIAAITEVELLGGMRLAEALRNPDAGMPNIVAAFEKEPIRRRGQQLDHILRLGRLTALERTAHLFLELGDRMSIAGLAHAGRFPMPLTQQQLGEALGLSLVHVNRTVQQLRRDGLIELKSGVALILDRERMELLCDYREIVV
jgi:CRP-like cAMP-binding protein